MSDTTALTQIENIAASYANSKGEYGKAQLYRYLQIILEGYQQWNIFNSTKKVNWYSGEIDSTGCVDYPVDMFDYIRIGTVINGQLYTLTRNDNLDMPIGLECGVVTGVDMGATLSGEPLYWNWSVTNYTATGGNNFAYYRDDKANRRIVFKGDCTGRSIVIEYVSSGVSLSGETFIPAELTQYLKLYLMWQLKLYAGEKDVEYFAREFAIEKQRLMNYQWNFRPDEFLDMIRGTFTRAIKR
jgi:hypothetical protein